MADLQGIPPGFRGISPEGGYPPAANRESPRECRRAISLGIAFPFRSLHRLSSPLSSHRLVSFPPEPFPSRGASRECLVNFAKFGPSRAAGLALPGLLGGVGVVGFSPYLSDFRTVCIEANYRVNRS